MKKGIVVVVGKDRVGIIYKVCKTFSDNNINILDITQTIVDGYFNMMMIVDLSKAKRKVDEIQNSLDKLGKSIGVKITLQLEDIFTSMHRI